MLLVSIPKGHNALNPEREAASGSLPDVLGKRMNINTKKNCQMNLIFLTYFFPQQVFIKT